MVHSVAQRHRELRPHTGIPQMFPEEHSQLLAIWHLTGSRRNRGRLKVVEHKFPFSSILKPALPRAKMHKAVPLDQGSLLASADRPPSLPWLYSERLPAMAQNGWLWTVKSPSSSFRLCSLPEDTGQESLWF